MPDEHCYQGPERRALCTDVLILRQRFEDEEKARESWRKEVDAKLEKIMTFISEFKTPLTLGIWATRIFFGTIILSIATVIFKFGGKIIRWLLGM